MSAGEKPMSMPCRAVVKPDRPEDRRAGAAQDADGGGAEFVVQADSSGTDRSHTPLNAACASASLSWLPEGFRNGCRNA